MLVLVAMTYAWFILHSVKKAAAQVALDKLNALNIFQTPFDISITAMVQGKTNF